MQSWCTICASRFLQEAHQHCTEMGKVVICFESVMLGHWDVLEQRAEAHNKALKVLWQGGAVSYKEYEDGFHISLYEVVCK